MSDEKKIKVLIVDDSAVVRQTLTSILESDPMIEVIGTASDPFAAAKKLQTDVPDVITLDVEMPKMDGITFLRKLMSQHPIPVVIISSLTAQGTQTAIRALESGAVDIITKPQMDTKGFLEESRNHICQVVKAAARSNIKRKTFTDNIVQPKLSADAVLQKAQSYSMIKTTEIVIAVGASTGGTEALREFLMALPHDVPGIVIVQHMPEKFTKSFADRLNELCNIRLTEAENGDCVLP